MVSDAEFLHACRQALAICLALISHKVRMGRAKNDIDGVRARFDDSRQGIEHYRDALVWRQETESQNDRLSGKAESRLGVIRFEERKIRYSVRYDLNLVSRYVMNRAEEFMTFR